MYEVVYTRRALKDLRRLTPKLQRAVRAKIGGVAEDPYARHNNVTKLQDRDGYRLTIGDWRVLYDLDDKRRTMDVLTVLKREEAYR